NQRAYNSRFCKHNRSVIPRGYGFVHSTLLNRNLSLIDLYLEPKLILQRSVCLAKGSCRDVATHVTDTKTIKLLHRVCCSDRSPCFAFHVGNVNRILVGTYFFKDLIEKSQRIPAPVVRRS